MNYENGLLTSSVLIAIAWLLMIECFSLSIHFFCLLYKNLEYGIKNMESIPLFLTEYWWSNMHIRRMQWGDRSILTVFPDLKPLKQCIDLIWTHSEWGNHLMQEKLGNEGEEGVAVALCVTSVSMLSLSRLSLGHYRNHSDATMHTAP